MSATPERAEVIPLHDQDRRARYVYDLHVGALTRYAELLAGASDAPDLVQEAMVILFSSGDWQRGRLGNDPGDQRVAAFLRTTVHNRYKMLVRGSTRRRDREFRVFRRDRLDDSYEDRYLEIEEVSVHEAMASLKGRQAECVRLFLIGLTPQEIAAELGIRDGSVRTHLRRGFDKLRPLLGPREEDPE